MSNAKKQTFPEPGCITCQYRQVVGKFPLETRYCSGFKRKKPKRFKQSDPQFKAPRWCPRRLSAPVCRIHGFSSEQAEFIEQMWRTEYLMEKSKFVSPSPSHFVVRKEFTLGMTAKAFYDATQESSLDDFFPEKVKDGEVIEIDNGLKSYFFYILNPYTIQPLPYFRF